MPLFREYNGRYSFLASVTSLHTHDGFPGRCIHRPLLHNTFMQSHIEAEHEEVHTSPGQIHRVGRIINHLTPEVPEMYVYYAVCFCHGFCVFPWYGMRRNQLWRKIRSKTSFFSLTYTIYFYVICKGRICFSNICIIIIQVVQNEHINIKQI